MIKLNMLRYWNPLLSCIIIVNNLFFGVNYVVEQGDAFSFPRVYTEMAHSLDDNFATTGEVVNALYCDQFQLFGSLRVHPSFA